ncbi:MFS transporter [Elusimicrobiota bacterium]
MLRSLKNSNFRLFFIGQTISYTGTFIQMTTLPWLIYRVSGSSILLGMVGFLSQIFILFLSPVAGAIADHFDRRKLIILTQALLMIQALILAYLTIMNYIEVWHILSLTAFMGIINALDMPARQSLVADMVEKKDLMNAIGLNSLVLNTGRMIGPAIAGILISVYGEGFCFLINGISFIAVLFAIILIKPLWKSVEYVKESFFKKILSGISYTKTHPNISVALILLTISGFLTGFPIILMPVIVKDIYLMDASGLGIFMGAMGAGALFGAITMVSKKDTSGIKKIIFGSAVSFAVLVIIFALIKNFFIAIIILVALGYLGFLHIGFSNTFIQLETSNAMRGRVMSFFVMSFMGFVPIGSLIAGFLSDKTDAQTAITTGGVFALILMLACCAKRFLK